MVLKLKFEFQTWFNFYNKFLFNRKYFNKLLSHIKNQRFLNDVYPSEENMFKPFRETSYDSLRVVILGHEPNVTGISNGLAFGIDETKTLDSDESLRKIEANIENNVKDGLYFIDYSLIDWAKQGVLLLNSSLTVLRNSHDSHSIYWKTFIKHTLKELSIAKPGIIYVLIGSQARSFKEFIKGSNYILEYPHPTETDGDWNESVFNDINNLIEKSNGKEFCIEW